MKNFSLQITFLTATLLFSVALTSLQAQDTLPRGKRATAGAGDVPERQNTTAAEPGKKARASNTDVVVTPGSTTIKAKNSELKVSIGPVNKRNTDTKAGFVDLDTQSFSGNGGKPFSDSEAVVNKGPISKIVITYGNWIDSIRLYYGGEKETGVGDEHGGRKGDHQKEWIVPEGHKIIRIEGRYARYVDSLKFYTDKGAESPLFGGTGGEKVLKAVSASGSYLRTISGNADDYLDKITFHFGAPCYIKEIRYDENALRQAALKAIPDTIAFQNLENLGKLEQLSVYKKRVTLRNESSFSWDLNESLSIESEINVGIPLLANGTIKMTAAIAARQGMVNTKSQESEENWEIPVRVPGRRVMRCVSTVRKYTLDIPITYTVAWYQGDRKNIIKEQTFAGSYKGVTVTDLDHKFTPFPLSQ